MDVSYNDIISAAGRLDGLAVQTPLLEVPLFNELIGVRVLLKAEMLQRTGSFKFRGAYNAIAHLSRKKNLNGIIAYSSGNHAQGVAHAASILSLPSTIVMPKDAPLLKMQNTRLYGAEIVTYDRFSESREEIGLSLANNRNLTLIKPYDDPLVIAGQGTVGSEIVFQCEQKGVKPDAIYVPCGGGGLIAGIGLAISQMFPSTKIYAVEPENFDDTRLSLKRGKRVNNRSDAHSICDALLAEMPGELTFSINSKLLSGGFAVSDKNTRVAMKKAFQYFKLITEPGGAVALGAFLENVSLHKDQTVVIVCSGGNVDAEMFVNALI